MTSATQGPGSATADNIRRFIDAGDEFLQTRDFASAERSYQKALDEDPSSAEALCSLGCVAAHRGDFEASEAWQRKALQKDPTYRPAIHALGNALFAQERYEEALEVLLGSQPGEQEHRVLAQIGLLNEKLGRWPEAEACFRRILEQISSSYATRYAAVALHDSGAFSADIHHALARVLQRQGNRDEAWLHYHLARRVDPTIDLDPMFREILTEDDIENHVGFDRRTAPKPAEGAQLADKVAYALQVSGYDALVECVRELGLDRSVEELAQYIRASQQMGEFVMSARFRLLGDLATGGDARALDRLLSAGGCLQVLEIAQEHHAGRVRDSEGEELAQRVELDAETLVAFVALLRRYVVLQPETSRSVVMMARAALDAAPQEVAHGYARLLWGEYLFATDQNHEAAKSLAAACAAFDRSGDVSYAVPAFEKLCRAQHQIGKVAEAEASARTFVQMARRSRDTETIVAALGLLAQHLGMGGKYEECHAVALEASALLGDDDDGSLSHLREGIEETLRRVGKLTAAAAPGRRESGQGLTDWLHEAHRLIQDENLDEAWSVLEAAVAQARTQNRTGALVQGLLLSGRVERARGHLAEARKLLDESLARGESSSFPIDKVPVLIELAQTAEEADDAPAAIRHAERALREARRQGNRQYEAYCHKLLASLLVDTDKTRAVEHFGDYLRLSGAEARELGGSTEDDLLEQAQTAFQAHDYPKAIEAFEAFLRTAPEDSPHRPTAMANLALARYGAGDAEGAVRGLGEAATAFDLAGDRHSAVDVLTRGLKICWEKRLESTALVARLMETAQKCDNPGERRGCLTAAAVALADIDRLSEAEALAKAGSALAESEEWRDARDAVECRKTLGRACRMTGRFGEAVAHYGEALKGAQFLKDEPLEGTIRGWKAVSHRYLGQLDVAVDEYNTAISIAQVYHDPFEEVMHRSNLVAALRDLGQEDAAREHALAALEISERVDNPRLRERVLSMLYVTFKRSELPTEVQSLLEDFEARALDSSDHIVRCLALTARACRLIDSGARDEGVRLFDDVIATFARVSDGYNQASAHLNRARHLHHAGDWAGALRDTAEARRLAVTIGNGALQLECDEFLLHVGCDDDDEDAVEVALKDILPAWSGQRRALRNDRDRVSFADRVAPMTDRAIAFFLTHGQKARAFTMMEWGRAQAFSDLMAESLAEAAADGGARGPAEIGDARAVLSELRDRALLVNLTYVGDELTAVVVRESEEDPDVIPTGFTRPQIGVLLQDFHYDMLRMRGQGAMIWQGAADRLVQSFEKCIEPDSLVMFLVEEDLQVLPLGGARLTSGKYLVEHAAVGYAPSVTVLRDLAARRNRSRERGLRDFTAVGIAFPDEALAINQIMGGMALTGNHLQKKDLKEFIKNSSVVHLSCHGHFDPKLPAHSGLHLRSPSTTFLSDILSVRDLAQWRLSADLVVLSACETGRGEVAVTEFLGLTRNLLASSTNAVVATLWPVLSRPTRDFMLAFYGEIKQTSKETDVARIADALRKVQRQFCSRADFYDWAAFKVVGWPNFGFGKGIGENKGE